MALTRKLLKGMGLTDEQVDTIIEAHAETVDGLKQYKADADKLAAVQKELDELKTSGGDWKQKYDDEKKAHEDYRAEISAKEAKAAKTEAFRKLLKDNQISEKRIDTVIKASGSVIDGIELDKDGAITKADELAENIKNEWADFIVTTDTSGAKVDHPPKGGKTNMTKDEILKIKDTAQRQAAIAENHELFGF